jgi:hypothetical protein
MAKRKRPELAGIQLKIVKGGSAKQSVSVETSICSENHEKDRI